MTAAEILVLPVAWPREVRAGDDLTELAAAAVPQDGDVLVLTSKVVSKAEDALHRGPREDLIDSQSQRVVARRGPMRIVETRHGFVMAAAGVDASNVSRGTVLSLPRDPDRSARELREAVRARLGRNVAVVVSDTVGRAWRLGQTDLAIGCAGLLPLLSLQGTRDSHGNELRVTAPAIADELAGAADLVKGKVAGRPLAVVRGAGHWVLPPGEHGPGVAAMLRRGADDLFGLGAREAVIAAVRRDDEAASAAFPSLVPGDRPPFELFDVPPPVTAHVERHEGADGWTVTISVPEGAAGAALVAAGRVTERVHVLAAAHRLRRVPAPGPVSGGTGATVVDRALWVTS
jgi:coenzyme F420-0:L-glutamate ligase/coenzyme F420-1:gamma-L-glutamate ligase